MTCLPHWVCFLIDKYLFAFWFHSTSFILGFDLMNLNADKATFKTVRVELTLKKLQLAIESLHAVFDGKKTNKFLKIRDLLLNRSLSQVLFEIYF